MASLVRGAQCCRRFISPLSISRLACVRQYVPQRNMSESKGSSEDDAPIKFSTSQAASWKSYDTFAAPRRSMPWYQPPIVIVSISVFLLYFCVFREENDLDQEIGKSLYKQVPGLEESQLRASIKYEQEQGRDTEALRQRLAEVRAAR